MIPPAGGWNVEELEDTRIHQPPTVDHTPTRNASAPAEAPLDMRITLLLGQQLDHLESIDRSAHRSALAEEERLKGDKRFYELVESGVAHFWTALYVAGTLLVLSVLGSLLLALGLFVWWLTA